MTTFHFQHQFQVPTLDAYIIADDYEEAIVTMAELKLPDFNLDHWFLIEVYQEDDSILFDMDLDDDE